MNRLICNREYATKSSAGLLIAGERSPILVLRQFMSTTNQPETDATRQSSDEIVDVNIVVDVEHNPDIVFGDFNCAPSVQCRRKPAGVEIGQLLAENDQAITTFYPLLDIRPASISTIQANELRMVFIENRFAQHHGSVWNSRSCQESLDIFLQPISCNFYSWYK